MAQSQEHQSSDWSCMSVKITIYIHLNLQVDVSDGEESQSLLPQPVTHHHGVGVRYEASPDITTASHQSGMTTNPNTHHENLKHDIVFCANRSDKSKGNLDQEEITYTGKNGRDEARGITTSLPYSLPNTQMTGLESQPDVCTPGFEMSQVSGGGDQLDSLQRLEARLDRLVSSLDKVPRRQVGRYKSTLFTFYLFGYIN